MSPHQPPAQAEPNFLQEAARDVIAERVRQHHGEGHTPARDAFYADGQLAVAAACYAFAASTNTKLRILMHRFWPWPKANFKPHDRSGSARSARRRCAVKAAALLLAEIERLDREDHAVNKAMAGVDTATAAAIGAGA